MNLDEIKKAYFIGIGGIGMSALARYFKSRNIEICGSDRDFNSDVVKSLESEGIKVFSQENSLQPEIEEQIKNADVVIYTLAIPDDSPEMICARDSKKQLFTYAQMLGIISTDNFTIAVSGTHGKTSTTAMAAEIAKNLELKPNVIVGSFLNWENSDGDISKTNFVPGDSNLFIVEACEYKKSFHNLSPDILIITNLEADHLDYYKDLDDVRQAFYDLALKLPENGKIICNKNDKNLGNILTDFADKIIDYSEILEKVPEMSVFGQHNKENAAAAISAIQSYLYLQKSDVEIESQQIFDAIKSFKGTWRRMEYKGQVSSGATVYDDYGHHPTEVRATLEAFRENFPDKKICLVFQAHLHSRTKIFFDEFVHVLSDADRSIIYPIYRARAEEDFGVSAELLVEKINEKTSDFRAEFSDSFDEIAGEIEKLDGEWIVILLGAGEVYQIAEKLKFI
jgi:UDP-N-acetylmuramate--alanine ligase